MNLNLDLHYTDERLVALYDIDNTFGPDTEFYIKLANRLQAQTILDFGCGTGLLTCQLASEERRVIGVDPSGPMLDVAKSKPNADKVTWIKGDKNALRADKVDLAIMTGNVAQVFIDDCEWNETLQKLWSTLRIGGILAFESRNPEARAWEQWDRNQTYEKINSPFGSMECWLEVTEVHDGLVTFAGHNVFTETGEHIVAPSTLRFRSSEEIQNSLIKSGFRIQNVFGTWNEEPFCSNSRVMIFIAEKWA